MSSDEREALTGVDEGYTYDWKNDTVYCTGCEQFMFCSGAFNPAMRSARNHAVDCQIRARQDSRRVLD